MCLAQRVLLLNVTCPAGLPGGQPVQRKPASNGLLAMLCQTCCLPALQGIWLAAFKLEFENHEPERARAILEKAREGTSSTQKVWMKSALVERELGNSVAERRMLDEGLKRYLSRLTWCCQAGEQGASGCNWDYVTNIAASVADAGQPGR